MVQRLGWLYLESEMGGSQSPQCQGGPGRGRPNRSAYQTKRCFFNQSGQPTVNDQLGHRHSDPFGQLGFHCKENNSPNIPYNRGVCPDSEGIHIRSSAWNSFHSGCLNDRGLKWPGNAILKDDALYVAVSLLLSKSYEWLWCIRACDVLCEGTSLSMQPLD